VKVKKAEDADALQKRAYLSAAKIVANKSRYQIQKAIHPFVCDIVPSFRADWVTGMIASLTTPDMAKVLESYDELVYRAQEANTMIKNLDRDFKSDTKWIHDRLDEDNYYLNSNVKKAIKAWINKLISQEEGEFIGQVIGVMAKQPVDQMEFYFGSVDSLKMVAHKTLEIVKAQAEFEKRRIAEEERKLAEKKAAK